MLSSDECLAKARQLDERARKCVRKSDRDSYVETANGWRYSAAMALHQETWAALIPPE